MRSRVLLVPVSDSAAASSPIQGRSNDLLGVPDGPVGSEVAALAMARGAGRLLEANVAVAVTGVGGLDPQEGERPGTVWAATGPDQLGGAVLLRLSGSPESICEQVCAKMVGILRERLELTAARASLQRRV